MGVKKLYRKTLKEIADTDYGKEVLFYQGDGIWYNRDTCKNQTEEEMCDWLLKRVLGQLML